MVASVLARSFIKKIDFSLEAIISNWLNVLFRGDRKNVLDKLSETFPWTLTVKMNLTISTNDGWRCTHCTTCQSTTPHPRDTIVLRKVKQHVISRVREITKTTDVSFQPQFMTFASASSFRFFLVYLGLGSVIFPFSEAQMLSRWWNLIQQLLLFQRQMMRRRQTPWSYLILTVLSFTKTELQCKLHSVPLVTSVRKWDIAHVQKTEGSCCSRWWDNY